MFDAPQPLCLGGGRSMYAKGIGDIQVEMLIKGKWNPGSLTNVWYISESGQRFLKSKGIDVKLDSEFCDACKTGPTPEEGKSPYEIWVLKKSSVDHLKIFGTECFIQNPKQIRRKFNKKAIKGYSVGYCGEKDSYHNWVLDRNGMLSRDVVFKDEITSEKTSIEIVQTRSTEEVCEEDASCI
ncbi:hypothetical protein AVEN_138346-1 [Araneus ventricosus]|uniref:Retroviral polymerase SH3-like domain-containing protein n=1 Tax=Araneus ventricosus TaxID=182803 RepID=A0A4Y2NG06_ARAVE|nr:hypothetical protein AVEN_138346-1 [Araneus ventricosus]